MKKLLIILVVAFIIIQFFPIDKVNPPVDKKMDFLTVKNTPESTANIIRTSCYNCHSNESVYPWYSNIAPVSWYLKNHINDGRKHLNFSTFATYDAKRQMRKLDESIDEVNKGDMPLESYTIIHQDARLTDAQKKELTEYFKQVKTDIEIKNSLPANNGQQPNNP